MPICYALGRVNAGGMMGSRVISIILCTCSLASSWAVYSMNQYTFDGALLQRRIDRSRMPQQLIPVVTELLGVARYITERVAFRADTKQAWLCRLTQHIQHLKSSDGWRQVSWLLCSVKLLDQFACDLTDALSTNGDFLQSLAGIKEMAHNATALFVQVVPLVNCRGRLLEPDYHWLYQWLLSDKTLMEWHAKELLINRYGIYDDMLVKTAST